MHTFLFSFFPQQNLQNIKDFYFYNNDVFLLEAQTEEAYLFYIRNHKIDNFFFYYDTKITNIQKILTHLHKLPIYTSQPCNLISDKAQSPSFDLSDFVCTKFFTLYNQENHPNQLIRFIEESHHSIAPMQSSGNGFFQAKSGKQILNIPLQDILYIESMSKKSILHTVDGTFTISMPLYKIQESLPENIFIRTHRSFIVNVHKISKVDYETKRIEFSNSTAYALLSRTYRKTVTTQSIQKQNFLL